MTRTTETNPPDHDEYLIKLRQIGTGKGDRFDQIDLYAYVTGYCEGISESAAIAPTGSDAARADAARALERIRGVLAAARTLRSEWNAVAEDARRAAAAERPAPELGPDGLW